MNCPKCKKKMNESQLMALFFYCPTCKRFLTGDTVEKMQALSKERAKRMRKVSRAYWKKKKANK